MMTNEKILIEGEDKGAWICICKNTPSSGGFYPCDADGNELEPTVDSGWDNKYICGRCGRIINQDTLEIVGVNPNPKMLY